MQYMHYTSQKCCTDAIHALYMCEVSVSLVLLCPECPGPQPLHPPQHQSGTHPLWEEREEESERESERRRGGGGEGKEGEGDREEGE